MRGFQTLGVRPKKRPGRELLDGGLRLAGQGLERRHIRHSGRRTGEVAKGGVEGKRESFEGDLFARKAKRPLCKRGKKLHGLEIILHP